MPIFKEGLQQGFATGEMGLRGQIARQQSRTAHVRFGSKADIEARPFDVRFTPESGHSGSAAYHRDHMRAGNIPQEASSF